MGLRRVRLLSALLYGYLCGAGTAEPPADPQQGESTNAEGAAASCAAAGRVSGAAKNSDGAVSRAGGREGRHLRTCG